MAAESRIYDPRAQKSDTTSSATATASAKGVFPESPFGFWTTVLRRSVVPLNVNILLHHRRESGGGPICDHPTKRAFAAVLAVGIVLGQPLDQLCAMLRSMHLAVAIGVPSLIVSGVGYLIQFRGSDMRSLDARLQGCILWIRAISVVARRTIEQYKDQKNNRSN